MATTISATLLSGCGSIKDFISSFEDVDAVSGATSDVDSSEDASNQASDSASEESDDSAGASGVIDQGQIIYDNRDVWETEVDSSFDGVCYAVTDFDNDGWLEIVSSMYNEKEFTSENHIYEVDKDNNLVEMDIDALNEVQGGPDLYLANAYYPVDYETFITWFSFKENEEADEASKAWYVITIEDNKATIVEEYSYEKYGKYISLFPDKLFWFTDITMDNINRSFNHEYIEDKRDTTGMYTSFLNGYQVAKCCVPQSLMGEYSGFKCEEGKELSIKDICDILDENCYSDYAAIESYKYIDCGNDGEYELCIRILAGMGYYNFVIKEYSDGLRIKYYAEEGEKIWAEIDELGHTKDGGRVGYYGYMDRYGYLDENADYVFLYRCVLCISASEFLADEHQIEVDEDTWDGVEFEFYYFDEDSWLENCYVRMIYWDAEAGAVDEDNLYDPNGEFMKTMTGAGYDIHKGEDIDNMIEERKQELGLTY